MHSLSYSMGQLKGSGRQRPLPVRFRYLLLFATVFGGGLLLLSFNARTDFFLLNTSQPTHHVEITDSEEGYTIKTEGCSIPGLRPFDDSIKHFSERPNELGTCRNSNRSLLENNETHIWVVTENLHYYNIPNVSCCYKWFYRPAAIADINSLFVDDRVQYGKCIHFANHIEVFNEFVKVSCRHERRAVYEKFFLFARRKPFASYSENSVEMAQNRTGYNVIVIGIDAISRLNFYRTMPRTLSFLKRKGAIELLGYNKVGDNTFPNLAPMLLGIKDTELKETCWPNLASTFDHCPFIWDWYKDAGYYTAFGEDSAYLGTFNYEKAGFAGTPTDYYIHTFINEAESHVGNNRDFNSFICMGDKYFYKVLLDYIQSLTSALRNDKLFGFFWEVTMTHDHLNYPMLIDESYEMFLQNLDNKTYLDNTVLILLSDHGIRWGDIRYTKQGRLEERLPLFHILLPPSFKENYSIAYNNLKINRRRLTTPFDIHATLFDLINLERISNEQIVHRSTRNYAGSKSISLFLPIPTNRTCKMAGIDDHWCTCHRSTKVSTESRGARQAAAHLVSHMNLLLRNHVKCAKLELAEIMEVTEMDAGTPGEYEIGWREFMVVARMRPGGGVFEATLRHDGRRFALAGTISRLNLYGDQSRCVHHYQLKLYCYCT